MYLNTLIEYVICISQYLSYYLCTNLKTSKMTKNTICMVHIHKILLVILHIFNQNFQFKKKTKKNKKKPQNSSLPKFILSCNKNASWIIKNVSTTSTTILSHAPNWYNVFRNIHSYSITKHALGTIERTKSAMLGYLAFLRSYRHRVLIWVLKHLPLTTTRDPSYQKRDSLGNWSTPISLVLFPSIVSYKLF